MKMRTLFTLLLVPLLCRSADIQGDVYKIDVAANSITIASNTKLTTYRVRPGAEITINGTKAKIGELSEGMTAKVVSAEPTIASKIIANGIPKVSAESSPALMAAAKQIEALSAMLKDSKWDLKEGKTFVLHADGTAKGSWHRKVGFWKVTGPSTIDMHISLAAGPPEHVTVSPDGNFLRWGKESAIRLKE